jgi:hypothetical protein
MINTMYISMMVLFAILAIMIALAGPYLIMGIKIKIGKMKYKDNAGILLRVNKAGNIGKPVIIDLRATKVTIKEGGDKKDYPYSKTQIQQGTFFGMPYIILDVDDVKTSVGIYHHQCDTEGNPMYLEIANEKGEVVEKQPVLSSLKPSVTLPPTFFQALVGDTALTMALKDLLSGNKQLFYVLLGVAFAAAAGAYFGYELYSVGYPAIMAELASIKGMIAQVIGGGV